MHDLPIVDPHMHLWDLDRLRHGGPQDDLPPNNPAAERIYRI